MPYVSQVAVGRRESLSVFGDDYDTPDGTGVRDYIHVEDLARGHLSALKLAEDAPPALRVYNLGTGIGYSVLQMVAAMEKASGRKIPYGAPRGSSSDESRRRRGRGVDISRANRGDAAATRIFDW